MPAADVQAAEHPGVDLLDRVGVELLHEDPHGGQERRRRHPASRRVAVPVLPRRLAEQPAEAHPAERSGERGQWERPDHPAGGRRQEDDHDVAAIPARAAAPSRYKLASGLRETPWNAAPDLASAAPTIPASTTRETRGCQIIAASRSDTGDLPPVSRATT
jgi:hypothetical protein